MINGFSKTYYDNIIKYNEFNCRDNEVEDEIPVL